MNKYIMVIDDSPTIRTSVELAIKDLGLPIQQAETFLAKLEKAGVPTELVVKTGAEHLFDGWEQEMPVVADWFDKYLGAKRGAP